MIIERNRELGSSRGVSLSSDDGYLGHLFSGPNSGSRPRGICTLEIKR
jgi:hypothetical protein